MKNFIFLVLINFFVITTAFGQVGNYTFSQSSGTYTEITGGSLLGTATNDDQNFTNPTDLLISSTTGLGLPIGFNFTFGNVVYDRVGVNANGWISLGTSLTTPAVNASRTSSYTPLASINAIPDNLIATVAAATRDLNGQVGATLRFETIGTAPNRILVLQWQNYRRYNEVGENLNFQIRLSETSNIINLVYGTFTVNTTILSGVQVGLRGPLSGVANNIALRTSTSSWAATVAGTLANETVLLSAAITPASGLTFTFTPPACLSPEGLVTSNISNQGATLNWTALTPAPTSYQYIVQTSAVLPTAATAGISTATSTAAVTGLAQNTIFNVFLRASCSTGFSNWFNVGSFRTLCNDQSEFIEFFDSYATGSNTLADCWSRSNSTGSVNLTTGSVAPGSAPNRLFMSCLSTTTAVAVLPGVSNLQANTHRLVFTSYATAAAKTIDIGYLTDPANISSFVVFQTLTLASTTAASATIQTVIPSGIPAGIKSLAFRITGSSITAYLDDVKWELNTTCVEPTSLIATGITNAGATISFNEPVVPAANGYDFFVSVTNITPASTATPTGSVMAGLNSFDLTGYAPNTTFFVWVRSKCSLTARSPWTSSINFLTNCNAVSVFTENFDAAATFPNCWKKVGPLGTATITASNPSTAPRALNMSSSTVSNRAVVVMTPVTNAGAGTHQLKFNYRASSTAGGNIEIGYLTDNFDANTFTPITAVTATSLVYATAVVNLGTAAGANQFLAFRHSGVSANAVLIDDVTWELLPTCPEPIGLSVANIQPTAVDFSWIEPSIPSANGYQYFVSVSSTTPIASTSPTGSVAAGVTTVNIATGLAPNTTYFVWVRGRCAPGDISVWSQAISFRTTCLPTSLPWSESFETTPLGDNQFPACWTFQNTLLNWNIETTPVAFEGVRSLGRTWSTDGWAFTPTFSLLAGTSYSFSYYIRTVDAIVGYDVITGVGTAQNAAGMTTTLSTVTAFQNPVWTQRILYFTPTTSGSYSFGIRAVAATSAPNGINFDSFKVELTPSCVAPTDVTLTAVTTNTATFSWSHAAGIPSGGYQYIVSATSTVPAASATPTATVATGTTATATGLTAATQYFLFIRSSCGAGIVSTWSAGTSFTTECGSIVVPTALESAEGTTGANLPICWSNALLSGSTNWIGYTAPGGGDENSLPVTGTRIFRKTYNSSDALLFSAPMNYGPITAPTRVSLFLQRNSSAHVSDQYKIFVNTTKSLTGAVQIFSLSLLSTVAPTAPAKGFYNYTADIPVSFHGQTTVYVIIQGTTAGGFSSFSLGMDDFKVEFVPSCIIPTNIALSNITTTTATLTWTAPSPAPANGYEYFVSASSTAPIASTTPTAAVAASPTTTSITSGLVANTTYNVWMRSVCSTSDRSSWTSRVTFTTPCAVFMPPYNQDFATFPLPCFTTATTGTVATGPGSVASTVWTEDGFLNAGATGAIRVNLFSTNRIAWLITPTINLSTGSFTLKFDYGITTFSGTAVSTMAADDSIKILISTDGTSWSEISQFTAASNINNLTNVYSYNIPTPTATTRFAFLANDGLVDEDQDYNFYIDNLKVETTLNNQEFDSNSFLAYPNPVKDILNLQYSADITKVSVFNLLGQEVILKTSTSSLNQIDMSNLSKGTYLVKVTADNVVKTIKVIKE